jgi:hypothetical protein
MQQFFQTNGKGTASYDAIFPLARLFRRTINYWAEELLLDDKTKGSV